MTPRPPELGVIPMEAESSLERAFEKLFQLAKCYHLLSIKSPFFPQETLASLALERRDSGFTFVISLFRKYLL